MYDHYGEWTWNKFSSKWLRSLLLFSLCPSALCEATTPLYITHRALHSKTQAAREQLLILPMLLSKLALEILEALLWSYPNELKILSFLKIRHMDSYMIMATVMDPLLLSWKKSWLIESSRISGASPQCCLCVHRGIRFLLLDDDGPTSFNTSLRNMADFNHLSHLSRHAGTHIGKHGHLQWTVKYSDSYATPNAFTYFLLWTPIVFASPCRLFSGMVTGTLVVSGLLFV